MRNVATIMQRELAATFYSPIAYIVGFVFLLATGLWFLLYILEPGNPATLRPLFNTMAFVLIFCIPLLTMRTVAEEFSSGTIETLMTAPVTDTEVIVGKFLGTLVFYVVLLALTVFYLAILIAYSSPEPGLIVFGYVGMLLLGAMYIAVGIFTSACTRHQLLAAILGVAILAVFGILAERAVDAAPAAAQQFIAQVNVFSHFDNFSKGILDTSAVVYFVTATVFFLFVAVRVLESRRWR